MNMERVSTIGALMIVLSPITLNAFAQEIKPSATPSLQSLPRTATNGSRPEMTPHTFDTTLGNTLVAAGSTLVAAIIGGLIAAWSTRKATREATELALKHNRNLQEAGQRLALRGVLLAMRAELETLWWRYEKDFGSDMQKLAPGEAFMTLYPFRQDYFTVYDSNCGLIGQIPDDNLRSAIVNAYMSGKGLIDTHLHNNYLIERYEESERLNYPAFMKSRAMQAIKNYGAAVKDSCDETKNAVQRVLHLMNESDLMTEVPGSVSANTST